MIAFFHINQNFNKMSLKEKRIEAVYGAITTLGHVISIYKRYKIDIESIIGCYGYNDEIHGNSKILIWKSNIHFIKSKFLQNIEKNILFLEKFKFDIEHYNILNSIELKKIDLIDVYKNDLYNFQGGLNESIQKDSNINNFDILSFTLDDLLKLLSDIKILDNACFKMQFLLSPLAFKYDNLFDYKILFLFEDFTTKYRRNVFSLINPSRDSLFEPYLSEYMYFNDPDELKKDFSNVNIDHLKGIN